MKFTNAFTILGLVLIATACGSSQPATGIANGYSPYGSTSYPTTGGTTYNSQALYNSAGQLIGYKSTSSLISGSTEVASTDFQTSVSVNVGEKISVNLANSYYTIGRTLCAGFITFNTNFRTHHAIPNATLTLNGQTFTSGSVAPTAGTLVFSTQLSPLSANCEVKSYDLYLVGAVTKESCTNVNGQAMQCP
jgi:hypothetical protein